MENVLMKFIDSVGSNIQDLAVDAMINELILHGHEVSDYDPEVVIRAQHRTSAFINQYSQDLFRLWPLLCKEVLKDKKIALASAQLGGTTDEKANPCVTLQSESERSML